MDLALSKRKLTMFQQHTQTCCLCDLMLMFLGRGEGEDLGRLNIFLSRRRTSWGWLDSVG